MQNHPELKRADELKPKVERNKNVDAAAACEEEGMLFSGTPPTQEDWDVARPAIARLLGVSQNAPGWHVGMLPEGVEDTCTALGAICYTAACIHSVEQINSAIMLGMHVCFCAARSWTAASRCQWYR